MKQTAPRGAAMPMHVFESALAFLVRSGMREARLVGGEPTLHPNFLQMVDRILEKGLHLVLFTGGLIPRKALDRLTSIGRERLSVLLNVLDARNSKPAALRRQAEVCERLHHSIVPGLNISSPGMDLTPVLDLIDRYCLRRQVRLGVAHPTAGGHNEYLHPRHYPAIGRQAFEFWLIAQSRGIAVEWDCGWVPCMFPQGALERMGPSRENIGLRCNPILDVLTDGNVIACYPLALLHSEALPEEEDARDLRHRLGAVLARKAGFFLFKGCAQCAWRASSACTGGCRAAALRRVRSCNGNLPLGPGAAVPLSS